MKDKAWWLLLAGLISAAMIPAACATPSTTTMTTATTAPPPAIAKETIAPKDTPRHGGTLTISPAAGDIGIFDPVAAGQIIGLPGQLVLERYVGEDWTRGSAGTGELTWVLNVTTSPSTCMGMMAESWGMPTIGTIVFKVRRGVRWALNPDSEASRLMNGREATADDWLASFNYVMQHPRSYIRSSPQLIGSATMEKTGPWEVTLKTPVDPLIGWNRLALGWLIPPEVIQKYGDMRDWRNVVGTGPFVLTDYVQGSSATLSENLSFWEKDRAGQGKGNQLPYLDGVKVLVVTDPSTRQAALRTARIDLDIGVGGEDARNMIGSMPQLRHLSYILGWPGVIAMRLDKADLPYKDKRVRQALMMATDFDSLREFYGGVAERLAFPVTKEAERAYVPLEEMPEASQILYRYNPEKAKQLLAEAGYPAGFRAKVIATNSLGVTELASVYKSMWAKVGVDLELQVRESGTYSSIAYSRAYEDMMAAYLPAGNAYPACLNLPYFRSNMSPFGYVSDPKIDAAAQEIQKHIIIDMPGADRLFRELMPYLVEQAYYMPAPVPTTYSLWWPWVRNFYGEVPNRFLAYCWIDHDLKQDMTGRR